MASIKDDRGYNQGFEEVASTVIRFERRADKIISETSGDSNKTILEIGCGTGLVAHYIAQKTGMQVLGTDLCVPFVEHAKNTYKLPNLQYEVLDFNDPIGVAGRKFDYIVGNGILHHLYYNLDAALKTIYELLNDGGKLIFWEPNIYNPYVHLIFSYSFLRKKANLEPDEMAFSKSFIEDKLAKAGFQSSEVQYRDFLLPGIPEFLVKPSIVIGDVVEKISGLNKVSQSLFIVGKK